MSLTAAHEATFQRFIDAGNTVIGRPKRIVGKFEIRESKSGSTIEFGENVTLRNTIVHLTFGGGRLVFGNDVVYSAWTHVGPKSEIRIGDKTVFNREAALHAWEGASIDVGEGCLFSNVRVRTCDMHPIFDLETDERINRSKSVVIGNAVWLAEFSTVGKGSRIDDGSVIGSYSLVNGYIPANCVAVGTPAKVVRTGIYWKRALDMSDPTALPAASPPPSADIIALEPERGIIRTLRQGFAAARLNPWGR